MTEKDESLVTDVLEKIESSSDVKSMFSSISSSPVITNMKLEVNFTSAASTDLLHNRFGHPSLAKLQKLIPSLSTLSSLEFMLSSDAVTLPIAIRKVAKIASIQLLISLAAMHHWPLHQLDIKNAFLHGELTEEVYMEQPPGSIAQGESYLVCHLNRSLYGLKQSLRAWFGRFSFVVQQFGMSQSKADHSVYDRHNGPSKNIFLVVYVDEIIPEGISQLKQHLFSHFQTRDLEKLKYFLGIEIGQVPRLINAPLWVLYHDWRQFNFLEKKGHWYPADQSPSSLYGIQGYRVFIAIAIILGDGLYNIIKVLGRTLYDTNQTFLKDQIPTWVAIVGYVTIAIVSTITLPHIFHQLKWYYSIVIYIFAPVLSFCNAHGYGLTDLSLASTYGKLAIFTIRAWAGAVHGDVLASLATCGVMMNIVSTASDLTSRRLLSTSKELSHPLLRILPRSYCNQRIKGLIGKDKSKYIPLPMAMAIPFYLGSYFAIDMCIGSLILFIWTKINKAKADAFGPAVASGLICGDGIWTLPSSILALSGVNPPICMKFLSRKKNIKVDKLMKP
ncbi:putative metal-nicotianamine transporter YSL5 [Capsicum annuum]|nr:putative metal-nicotianamine transporter YSL5 [Capsicum annuum]